MKQLKAIVKGHILNYKPHNIGVTQAPRYSTEEIDKLKVETSIKEEVIPEKISGFMQSNVLDLNQYEYIISSRQNSRFPEGAIPLCIPYEDKEKVKGLDAKWCPNKKTWFWSFDKPIEQVIQ